MEILVAVFVAIICLVLYETAGEMVSAARRKKYEIPEYVLPLVYEGFPPDDLTWDDGWNKYNFEYVAHPMTVLRLPTNCEECGSDLVKERHDYTEIEGQRCAMVITAHCPKGHGWVMDLM